MLAPFGAGRLYAARKDITAATPIEFGVLQDCAIDFGFTTKALQGQNQLAVFVARGTAKWTVKAKTGILSGRMVNDLFFGQAYTSASQVAFAAGEAATVPASSTYTCTVANSLTFIADFGVVYTSGASQGLPLVNVASGPATGQYSFAAGVYTFSAGDASAAVAISYTYTTSTGGKIALTNQLSGTTPYFQGVFRNRDPRTGLFSTYVFNRLTSSKLGIASKNADYSIPEFDMEIMDDGTGNIGTMSFGDTA